MPRKPLLSPSPRMERVVVDNATDEDGKEFYDYHPSENVFYLVIDRQRTENNVYFLNAVTEKTFWLSQKQTRSPK